MQHFFFFCFCFLIWGSLLRFSNNQGVPRLKKVEDSCSIPTSEAVMTQRIKLIFDQNVIKMSLKKMENCWSILMLIHKSALPRQTIIQVKSGSIWKWKYLLNTPVTNLDIFTSGIRAGMKNEVTSHSSVTDTGGVLTWHFSNSKRYGVLRVVFSGKHVKALLHSQWSFSVHRAR